MLFVTVAKGIAAEAASYERAASARFFVGEAFRPDALRHGCEKHRG
jgi:hypothetical protein